MEEIKNFFQFVVDNEAALIGVLAAAGTLLTATGVLVLKLVDAGKVIYNLVAGVEQAGSFGGSVNAVKDIMKAKEKFMVKGELRQFKKALKKVQTEYRKVSE